MKLSLFDFIVGLYILLIQIYFNKFSKFETLWQTLNINIDYGNKILYFTKQNI